MKSTSHNRLRVRRAVGASVFVAALALSAAAPAFAYEGSWSSYITGGAVGFASRTWNDKNTTSNGTVIWESKCGPYSSGTVVGSVTYTLWKDELFDVNKGSAIYSCAGYREYTFARQPSGWYFFRIAAINGDTRSGLRVNVPSVGAKY